MQAKQIQIAVGRIIALLMLFKAGDGLTKAVILQRTAPFLFDAPPPPRPTDWIGIILTAIPITIYVILGVVLWRRPHLILPTAEFEPETRSYQTTEDWVRLTLTIVGTVALANGMMNIINGSIERGSFRYTPAPLAMIVVQPAIGIVLILVAAKKAWLLGLPKLLKERMFPPKTDYYSQLSDEEKLALRSGD